MKNENTFPQLCYRDEQFKITTLDQIAAAKSSLQNLLNTWHSIPGLPAIKDYKQLFELTHVPDRFYANAINAKGEPVPLNLIVAAREAKNHLQVGRMELWSIQYNTVILNQDAASALSNSMDVIVTNESQKKFVDAVVAYKDSGNYIHDICVNGTTLTFQHSTPFTILERHNGNILKVDISADALRQMVKEL